MFSSPTPIYQDPILGVCVKLWCFNFITLFHRKKITIQKGLFYVYIFPGIDRNGLLFPGRYFLGFPTRYFPCWYFSDNPGSQAPKFGNFSSQAPKFGNFQFTSPKIWKFSVHKPPLSETSISSQAPHFHNPGRTPLLDRKIYHLTLREGYCARFDDRTQSGLLWPSQKKKQWHRSQFSNAL